NIGAVIVVDTHYDTLGVSAAADDRDIRMAFRRLAKQLHPGFNVGDEEAARSFKALSSAYKVLRDAGTRAAHSAHLEQRRAMGARYRFDPKRDRAAAAAAGAAVPRQFWRETRRVAACCLIVGISAAAFYMFRNPGTRVPSMAIMELAAVPHPAAVRPTHSPNARQAQDDERPVPGDASRALPSAT